MVTDGDGGEETALAGEGATPSLGEGKEATP